MPRRPRHYVKGMPYHLVQRGNNRAQCFVDSEDRRIYLGLWRAVSARFGVPVHAYCLMSNHAHILCTHAGEGSISSTVKTVNSTFAAFINRKYQRTGTLWEGRHWSSLIQTRRYLLACYRYIELNPVRAGLVARPEEYPYSSYYANAMGYESWLTPHDEYIALANTKAARLAAYRKLFRENDEELTSQFRAGLRQGLPVGDDNFMAELEERFGITRGYLKRGRPRM